MLDRVSVTHARGVEENFSFTDSSNGIRIKDIRGLGPVSGSFTNSPKAHGYGSNNISTSFNDRNIVFSFELFRTPTKTVEDVRRDLYVYFPVGFEIELIFRSGDRMYQIFGKVESAEPEIFTKNPTMQVSVMCFDPYFTTYPSASDNILVPKDTTTRSVRYLGRVETGVAIEMQIRTTAANYGGALGYFEIAQGTNTLTRLGFRVSEADVQRITGDRFRPGDLIDISTIQGKKKATLYRESGARFSIIGALKSVDGLFPTEDQWPMLYVGPLDGSLTGFSFRSTCYPLAVVDVTVRWKTLVDGL